MSTVVNSRPRVKPVRTVRLTLPASPDNPFVILTIRVGSTWDDYCVRPLPADFGAAYEVEKIFNPDGAVYHVHLSDDGAATCECKGHLRWGHCKHGESILALRKAGKL
jgi:hypothetical protein